jgi:tRNA-modifying protein YgfZ
MMRRDVIVAQGPDTVKFLHSQLSQDIAAMMAGEVRWSFLLQPTGKLVALLRVVRDVDGDRVSLDTDDGHGTAVVEALSRFKIRTKCELTLRPSVAFQATWTTRLPELEERAEGPHDDAVDDAVGSIVHGFPVWGAELDEATIPNATGLVAHAASFTKGCYTGQELVERIDSRGGNVPRRLVGVDFPERPEVGELTVDGKVVGATTRVASNPSSSGAVALAYVSRAVEPGAAVTSSGGVVGLVRDLS